MANFDPLPECGHRASFSTFRAGVWETAGGSELSLDLVESPARVPIADRGFKSILVQVGTFERKGGCIDCPMVSWPQSLHHVSCALFNVSLLRDLLYRCPIDK